MKQKSRNTTTNQKNEDSQIIFGAIIVPLVSEIIKK